MTARRHAELCGDALVSKLGDDSTAKSVDCYAVGVELITSRLQDHDSHARGVPWAPLGSSAAKWSMGEDDGRAV